MTVASWPKRALAWLFDMHISMAFLVVAYVAIDRGFKNYDGWVSWAILIIALVVWWMVGFVNRCIWMGRTGQSWGRKLFDVSLVMEETGKPTGIWKAFMRENTHFLDYFTLGYGWFRPLKDRKGQTLADLLNKTITIEGKPPMTKVVLADATATQDTATPTTAPISQPVAAENV